MNRQDAIELAMNLAETEDADMVIGQTSEGEWIIAHTEDFGRQVEMIEGTMMTVRSDGPAE